MTELKQRIHENGIWYTLVGDYYIPNLTLQEEERSIGRYGRLHREYLKETKPHTYNDLILTEQRFLKLTVAMENEQKENNGRIAEIQALLRDSIDQESDIRQFSTEIRQCEAITELDEGILNHLIDKIMIGDVKKVNGEKVQEVRIFYNFVGEVAEMAA